MAVDIANADSVHNTAANLSENSQINSILNSSPHQRLTASMDSLLSDNGGVNMFYVFLCSQHSCGHLLEFLFACRGFRSRLNNGSPEKPFQVAKIIFRTYIKPGTNRSVPIAPHLKHEVVHRISAYYEIYKNRTVNAKIPEFDFTIFDRAQDAIKHILANTYYPKFLEHLKSPTFNNPTVSNPSDCGFSDNFNELFTAELDSLQPLPAISNSPWTKLFRKRNYRRVENNLSNDRRSSTPDVSSHCSPPFSPLLEGRRDMSVDIEHPTTGTPNIAVEAGTALDDGSCCCCCGCLEDCPRYADEALVAGDSHQTIAPRQSSDLGKDCTTTIGTSQSSNCLGPRVEDTYATVPLLECHPRRQASNSPDRNVMLRPMNLPSALDTCPGMNHNEDPQNGDKVHCQLQQIISAGNDFEKPASNVHGDAVTRSNLAQTDPSLFVFLLTKRLEKVKEVHEKMEKLKLWVNQVDEKNHVSSSLMGQEDTCFTDGTSDSTGKDQSLTNHEVTRTYDQVSRRAEVAQSKRTPWTQNVKSLEGKTDGVVNGAGDAPMTSEDDAQGILDDHCSRIWADEKEVFRGHRRISQSTTRRSRTAWPSVQDATRNGLSGQHHRAVVPISLSQQPNDIAFIASRRNSSRARAASSVAGCCASTQAGAFCNRAACANGRYSDARSTTSWDSGVVPEPVCPSHVYYRQKQQQERPSRDLQSACPPPMCLYQDQTDDLDRPIDDGAELDTVFPQLEEEEDGSGDLDAASLQALSSSTTELAIVNSEVTAKLVQHMARHYTRSAGQRAHSSQGHVVPDLGGVPIHDWSPNPFVRARRDKETTANACHLHYNTPAAAQYLNEQHQHTALLPDWEQTGTQNSIQYPGSAALLMTSQYGRSSARNRVFPTPSDTSSTFDSGISSTYDQLSLGEQDNRSRPLRHWPPDRRNPSVTVVTKYSRTPSVPRQPLQSCAGNFQWQPPQQLLAASATANHLLAIGGGPKLAAHHYDPCSGSHRLHSPGSGVSASSASASSAATCAHCHPATCHSRYHHHHHHLHHHHMFHRPHGMHARHQYQPHQLHQAGLCQSLNNGGSESTVHGSSCSNRSACSSNPSGGGQLLQHWLAFQQQSTEEEDQLEREQLQRDESACYARGRRATDNLQPGNLRKLSTAVNGGGQHRRSLTTGHRHRQRVGGDDCGSEASVSESHHTTGANGTTAANSGGTPCSTSSVGIIVGYYLCDDPVPYRTVWTGPPNPSPVPGGGGRCLGAPAGDLLQTVGALDSGRTPGGGGGGGQVTPSLTLGQFKQLIAKKGSYRYFFKKLSNEFGTGVVHEELTHDDTFLPLWDGKVVARVERVD